CRLNLPAGEIARSPGAHGETRDVREDRGHALIRFESSERPAASQSSNAFGGLSVFVLVIILFFFVLFFARLFILFAPLTFFENGLNTGAGGKQEQSEAHQEAEIEKKPQDVKAPQDDL